MLRHLFLLGITTLMHLVPGIAIAQSVIADYGPTRTKAMADLQASLRTDQAVEKVAAALSRGVRFPRTVTLGSAECGVPNAYYRPQNQLIVMCLELIPYISDGLHRERGGKSSPEDIARTMGGTIMFILLHELGHALIHSHQIPVLGKEEDAADQISAFLMLNTKPQEAIYALDGSLWFFRKRSIFYSRKEMSSEHALDPQRQSNLACWAYGKDPALYRFVLTAGYLSRERAVRCAGEYQQLDNSVRQLLGQHVDLPPR